MKLIPRQLKPQIQHALTVDRVVALMGSRQAGKTTLVRHLLESDREIQYYNLKDVDVRRHLREMARREFKHFSDRLIVLDEVQQMPDLLGLIQIQVDNRPDEKGQFLLLGSNHLLLNRQIKETLAGRVALFTLFPFSFRELTGGENESLLDSLVRCRSIEAAGELLDGFYLPVATAGSLADIWLEFSIFGGYPEFLTRTDPVDRQNWLNNFHTTYLETDLRELVNLHRPETFEYFERLLATRVGSLLNISELSRDCSLAADTVHRFLGYLRQLFVAWNCRPFHRNLGKRMMKMPKWYFTDIGVLRSLKNDFLPGDGNLFENCVMSELRKNIYNVTLRKDLFFARTERGVEADAVFTCDGDNVTFFVEVKSGATSSRSDIRHLRRFVESDSSHLGLLLNTGLNIQCLADRIWSVPVHWLFA